MFQKLVQDVRFPTLVYINETGKIIAKNRLAETIVGEQVQNVKELIENELKIRFHKVVIEKVKTIFRGVPITVNGENVFVDLELNVLDYERQHVIVCFFEYSFKMIYDKYYTLMVPRLFYKDISMNLLWGSKYFKEDNKQRLGNCSDDVEPVRQDVVTYFNEIIEEILEQKQGAFGIIHTIKLGGTDKGFIKLNVIPVLNRDTEVMGLLGIYTIVLGRECFRHMRNRSLMESNFLSSVISRNGLYAVSLQLSDEWNIEYLTRNFKDFGYDLFDLYNGTINWKRMVYKEDWERIRGLIEQCIKDGIMDLPELRYRICKADGKIVWVLEENSVIYKVGTTYRKEGILRILPEDCNK